MKNKRFKFIAVFIGLICSFIFNNKVSAEELTQFCEYTDPCISTEMIDNWVKNSDMDTSFYDSYLVFIDSNYGASYNRYLNVVFYNSEIFTIKYNSIYDENTHRFAITQDDLYYIEYTFYWSDSSKKKDFSSLTLSYGRLAKAVYINKNMYYSNQDLLDTDGNVVLKANSIDIPKEPEEEPITIINKMALFVNDIVVYFNENNISFYQILIGLFIFNFLVYVICYIVRRF